MEILVNLFGCRYCCGSLLIRRPVLDDMMNLTAAFVRCSSREPRMHLPRIVTNIRARWTCVAADGVIEMVDYNKCTQHFVVFIDTL